MEWVDLNCDMGESFGVYTMGCDEEAIQYITSANVACGFHASDPDNMRKTVQLAKKYGVAVGAHPSYPDLVGFGRRVLAASAEEITNDIIFQIGALWGFCRAEGVPLQHVKVHGALYNVAEKDVQVATAIAQGIHAIDEKLIMVCMAGSAMVEAARKVGISYVEEAFADRAYTAEGRLVSRKLPGAVIHDLEEVASRVVAMVKEKKLIAIDGTIIPVDAKTICVHGDTPGAVEMIKTISARLKEAGVELRSFKK